MAAPRRAAAETPSSWIAPARVSARFKVRGLGINARPARNAALTALAGELPASVLADLIGLSTTAAIHWCAIARRDWTGYLAARITGAGVARTG